MVVSRGQTLSPRRLLIGDYKRLGESVWPRETSSVVGTMHTVILCLLKLIIGNKLIIEQKEI